MTPPRPHGDDATEPAIRRWLTAHVAGVLKRAPEALDPTADLAALGLDSAEQLFLVAALEDWTGLDLPSDLPLDHGSINALSRYLATRLA